MKLWFQEEDDHALRFSYLATDVLYRGQSEFQKVDVIETEEYGRMLLIDGLVMITERDEFVYHELIAHVPALKHPNPKHVVVIGGGDGGTIRELLKHPQIEKITLCEIDALVVEASRQYFPQVASGFDDPRVELMIGDGVQFMADHAPNELDLVIVDSTDPIGPGEGLFSQKFYQSVAQALRSDGLMVCQSESPWYSREKLIRIHRNVAGGFAYRRAYIGAVPTYPRGLWSWTMAAKQPIDPNQFDEKRLDKLMQLTPRLKYLNAEVMAAVFALPNFFQEKITDPE